MIVKKELDDSLKKAGKFDTSDLDVFAQLFILFDFQGDVWSMIYDAWCYRYDVWWSIDRMDMVEILDMIDRYVTDVIDWWIDRYDIDRWIDR